MGSFSVGGLASGLDTKSIISQFMQIEGASKTKLDWKQQLWTNRQSAWGDLNTRLLSLKTMSAGLLNPSTWDVSSTPSTPGVFTATSGDPSRLSATAGSGASAATYGIDVTQLAKGEISLSNGNLGPSTAGKRASGAWYEGANNIVEGNENITALRTVTGASMGLATNSKITMNWTVNGVAQSGTFTVNTPVNGGQGTTLTQFQAWAQSTIGNGATVAWNASGQLEVTAAPGTANDLDALGFTAVNAANAPLPVFNASVGAATSTQTQAATDGGVLSNHNMVIQQGANTWNIALNVGDQKQDIVNKINAAGIGVTASLVSGNVRMASTTIGAASGFTVSGAAATMLNFSETQSAQDAQYSVNGTVYTSATNMNVTGAITDVALNLLSTTSTTLTVAAGSGSTGQTAQEKWVQSTKQKITDFVNQYNSVQEFVYQKTQAESRVTNPKNLGEYLQGPMSRDVRFSSVATDLRQQATGNVQGLVAGENFLSDIGIKSNYVIGAGSANGKLTIDDTKLEAMLNSDPAKVQALLSKVGGVGVSADDGIARRVNELVSTMLTNGKVDIALKGASDQVKDIQKSIDKANMRLDMKQKYYERMFASLETTLGKMQSQSSWLSSQFNALSGG